MVPFDDSIRNLSIEPFVVVFGDHDNNRQHRLVVELVKRHIVHNGIKNWTMIIDVENMNFDDSGCAQTA